MTDHPLPNDTADAARDAPAPSAAVAAVERLRDEWNNHKDKQSFRWPWLFVSAADKILVALRALPTSPDPAQLRRDALEEAAHKAEQIADDRRRADVERDKPCGLNVGELYDCEAQACDDCAVAIRALARTDGGE